MRWILKRKQKHKRFGYGAQEDEMSIFIKSMKWLRNFRKKINKDFLLDCLMREEMKPFFNFEALPNLKSLNIEQKDFVYPLGSYVVDGFKALNKLEDLRLTIEKRSPGTNYFFHGLLHLLALKILSLEMRFIKNVDWILFQEFLKKQENLETLSLQIHEMSSAKQQYLQQNAYLTDAIKELANKKHLKSLSLKSKVWSLEALSKGLAHLKMKNQLHSLILGGTDDTITSEEKPWKRVEGLCNFIRNQKDSLRTLEIFLPSISEENPATHIADSISNLKNLRKLNLSTHYGLCHDFQRLFADSQGMLETENTTKSQIKLKASKNWNPSLAKYFKRLKSLEEFRLEFSIPNSDSTSWYVDLMKSLLNLKCLRKIYIATLSLEELLNSHEKVALIIQELKDIKEIEIYVDIAEIKYDQSIPRSYLILHQITHEINSRQATRCDLMF